MAIYTLNDEIGKSLYQKRSAGPRPVVRTGNKRQDLVPKPLKHTEDFTSCITTISKTGYIDSIRPCRRHTIAQHGSQPSANLLIPILSKIY
jgi:hypothetical protein